MRAGLQILLILVSYVQNPYDLSIRLPVEVAATLPEENMVVHETGELELSVSNDEVNELTRLSLHYEEKCIMQAKRCIRISLNIRSSK